MEKSMRMPTPGLPVTVLSTCVVMPAMSCLPKGSAAAVVGVAPGSEQDRDVIPLTGIGDAEAQGNPGDEGGRGQLGAQRRVVVADVHRQLVAARLEGVAFEQCAIGAPVPRGVECLHDAVAARVLHR